MSAIQHPMADVFLLGFVCASSLVAALFFLRFWRDTHDPLFLAFTAFFGVQGISNGLLLGLDTPNIGSVWLFLLRLISIVAVLAAILWKNLEKS